MNFAEKLRVAMAQQNLNISQVGKKCGVSRATVSIVVNGKVAYPRLEILEKIANAVGLKMTIDLRRVSTEQEQLAIAE